MQASPRMTNTTKKTNTPSWLLLAFLAGCSTAAADPERPKDEPAISGVTLQTVREEQIPRYVTLVGTLRANREADVASEAAGRVVMIKGERGQRVEKGAIIARVDADAAALAQAEAHEMAKAARVQDEQANRDCARADRLFSEKAISAAEHDKMKASCQASVHNASAADVRVKRAGKTLADALIRAPFSGVIGERYVELGEHLMPGGRVVTLVDLEPLRLELRVPEASVAALSDGAALAFSVPALGEERFGAELSYFAPSLSSLSRDLVVEAKVTSPAGKLRPGMFVTAYLETTRVTRPVVPAAALAGTGPSRRVFVERDGALEERVVLVGEPIGGSVPIESGLAAGERIAAEANAELKDGAKLASASQ
jgi:membrane fusion protein (multidrug efflux system)